MSNVVPALNANAIVLKIGFASKWRSIWRLPLRSLVHNILSQNRSLGLAIERFTHRQNWRNRAIRASETLAPSARDVSTTRASTSAIVSYHVFRSRVRIVS
jgi:hypothetical protein